MKKLFGLLQQIGRALMLPVAVLPVAGLLLGIGSAKFSWMPELLGKVMAQSGGSIFGNLPLIFAIGVALGFAAYDGVAAVAATVGYFVLLSTMGVVGEYRGLKLDTVSGVQTLQMGVFGGILIGMLAGYLFQRFHRIEMPPALGFFAGKRFVPIVTGLSALGLGVVLSYVWPPIQSVIRIFSDYVATGNPALSVGIWGFVNRALLPFGLHHIWNNPFFFEIGSYPGPDGSTIHGDIHRFFAGDKSAGILGGGFLYCMFGLPAAALAIWHSARPERRQEVGGIMLSAAFTSFLTGITEPIEFAFLFVAPVLYGLHAVLAGLACWMLYALGGHVGFTFSHGMIDYVLFWSLHTKPWLVLLLGPVYALLYYVVFRWAIGRFDLKTPGREALLDSQAEGSAAGGLPQQILQALGGAENLVHLDACITRLRVRVAHPGRVDSTRLKALGAAGVVTVGDSLQVIFGTRSENLKTDMEALLRGAAAPAQAGLAPARLLAALGGAGNVVSLEPVAVTRIRVELRDAAALQPEQLTQLGVAAVQPLGAGLFHLVLPGDSAAWLNGAS